MVAAKPKVSLKFSHIYLVSFGAAARSEVRVTQRVPGSVVRPATCQFVSLHNDDQDNPIGVLDLTPEMWKEWYGKYPKGSFLPGMETAASAAETMVKTNENIRFGCPLCDQRFVKLEDAQRHTEEEGQKILGLFDVEVS